MAKSRKLNIQESEITVIHQHETDFISLTDIARHKDSQHTDTIIQNWMRNRNTIELLGFWEAIYNPNFKPLEFEGFRKQGLNNFHTLYGTELRTLNGVEAFSALHIKKKTH